MAKRSDVSVADRREAVLNLLRREEPATLIARRVGVSQQTLYRWRDEFLAGGEAALSAKNGKADGQAQRIKELERFHQTLKTEKVYWRTYDSPQHCRESLAEFRNRYNERRPHWALVPEEGGDPWVPAEVYAGDRTIQIPRWQSWARAAQEQLEQMLQEAA